jgi:hypothetical protein
MTERHPECDTGGTVSWPADSIETAFRRSRSPPSGRSADPLLFSVVRAGKLGPSALNAFSEHCD